MAQGFDLAIVGSTPFCVVLAGLMAGSHGKSVVMIADPTTDFRITRGFDLSVGPITRPETWEILQKSVPETQKLVARIAGGSALTRLDPLLVAESQAGADVLAHVRHLALGFGLAVERAADGAHDPNRQAIRIRDALLLDRRAFEAGQAKWLTGAGVVTLVNTATRLTVRRDGSGRIDTETGTHDVAQIVLGDDSAILSHLRRADIAQTLSIAAATCLVTEPVRAMPAPFITYLDRGVMVRHRRNGPVTCLAPGAADEARSRIRGALSGMGQLRRAGQVSFHRLLSADGAPAVGPLKGSRVPVLAGFDETRLFFAPSVARWLAGVPTPEEERYFAARAANRGRYRGDVADVQIEPVAETAA